MTCEPKCHAHGIGCACSEPIAESAARAAWLAFIDQADELALDNLHALWAQGSVGQTLARMLNEARAQALAEARDDIKARITTFRTLDADPQYMNALNDAWGLVANRVRACITPPGAMDSKGQSREQRGSQVHERVKPPAGRDT